MAHKQILFRSAGSVASALLLTEATMTEVPEDRTELLVEPEMAA